MSESENVSNEDLKSIAALVRPEFKIGFQRRRRHTSGAVSTERERPTPQGMVVKVIEMPKNELDKLPGLTRY